MTDEGFITEVSAEPLGSNLISDHVTGAVSIQVYNASDFGETGGTFTIAGTTYTYTATDFDTNTISGLTPALDADAEEDTKVIIPGTRDKWAFVDLGDEQDSKRCRVHHALQGYLDEGMRDDEEREAVVIDFDEQTAYWTVTEIIGTASIYGGDVDFEGVDLPATPTNDGLPPPQVTGVTVTALGFSSLRIRWNPIVGTDPTLSYLVYLDTVNPPVQLLAQTQGSQVATAKLGDGTDLAPETTYYAQVQATEVPDGNGQLSTVASGSPILIPEGAVSQDILVANELFSREGYFGRVSAEQIDTGTMDAVIAFIGTLLIGTAITLDEQGIKVHTPLGDTILPADGSNIDLKGSILANALTVLGSFALRGQDNEISKNASVTLETGVTAPKVSPTIDGEYDERTVHSEYYARSFVYHGTQGLFYRTGSLVGDAWLSPVQYNSGTGNYDFMFQNWSLTSAAQGNRPEIQTSFGGVAIVGDSFYVLCETTDFWSNTNHDPAWYVYQFNYVAGQPINTRFTYVRRWRYLTASDTTSLSTPSPYWPMITDDPVNPGDVVIFQAAANGDHYMTRYNSTGVHQNTLRLFEADGSTPFNKRRHMGGVIRTAADVGTSQWWVSHMDYKLVFGFSGTRARITANEFNLKDVNNQGLYWDGTDGRFKGLRTVHSPLGGGAVHHYSKIKDTDLATNPLNVVQTWRLADATGPDFAAGETEMGPPVKTTTFPKRSWMRIESGSEIPNDTGDPGDADSVSFYIARGTGTPARTSYLRTTVPAAGVTSVLLDEIPVTGGNPPATTSGFSVGAPAKIKSVAEGVDGPFIELRGSGEWRLDDDLNLDDTGWITWGTNTGADTPFATGAVTTCRYRRIGKRVYVEMDRVTGAAYNPAGVDYANQTARLGLPASVRPPFDVLGYGRLGGAPQTVTLTTAGNIIFLGGALVSGGWASGTAAIAQFDYVLD